MRTELKRVLVFTAIALGVAVAIHLGVAQMHVVGAGDDMGDVPW
jgi:hypothetical protein